MTERRQTEDYQQRLAKDYLRRAKDCENQADYHQRQVKRYQRWAKDYKRRVEAARAAIAAEEGE